MMAPVFCLVTSLPSSDRVVSPRDSDTDADPNKGHKDDGDDGQHRHEMPHYTVGPLISQINSSYGCISEDDISGNRVIGESGNLLVNWRSISNSTCPTMSLDS